MSATCSIRAGRSGGTTERFEHAERVLDRPVPDRMERGRKPPLHRCFHDPAELFVDRGRQTRIAGVVRVGLGKPGRARPERPVGVRFYSDHRKSSRGPFGTRGGPEVLLPAARVQIDPHSTGQRSLTGELAQGERFLGRRAHGAQGRESERHGPMHRPAKGGRLGQVEVPRSPHESEEGALEHAPVRRSVGLTTEPAAGGSADARSNRATASAAEFATPACPLTCRTTADRSGAARSRSPRVGQTRPGNRSGSHPRPTIERAGCSAPHRRTDSTRLSTDVTPLRLRPSRDRVTSAM